MQSLIGRLLVLTIFVVMLAELLIFVLGLARFTQDFMSNLIDQAQIASLILLSGDMVGFTLEHEILDKAGVLNVVLSQDTTRYLVLSSPMPDTVSVTYDMRISSNFGLIWFAFERLFALDEAVIRIIGYPVANAGDVIEVTVLSSVLRDTILSHIRNTFLLSALISGITAGAIFLMMRLFFIKPIRKLIRSITQYTAAPQDISRVIKPSAGVTELRTAEEALQILQKQLSAAFRQKARLVTLGEAVAKISHDLRNILAVTQILADRLETSQDAAVRRAAPKLLASLDRAVCLCETTLAFGKAQEALPNFASHKLISLVEEVFEETRLLAGDASGIDFLASIDPEITIYCDGAQMRRVLRNLVDNAWQAASSQGTRILVRAQEDEKNWVIYVSDTGPGLPAQAQKNLFMPFQGGGTEERSGLGLNISRELIRGHGGYLELVETGPEGTIFCIKLPKRA